MLNCISTLPGPCTGTSCPAAITTLGPATSGTATEMLEIFRKSRRETPDRSSVLGVEPLPIGSSSDIRKPPQVESSSHCSMDEAGMNTSALNQLQPRLNSKGSRYAVYNWTGSGCCCVRNFRELALGKKPAGALPPAV